MKRMSSIRVGASLALLLALGACDVTLTAISLPPPGAIADLDRACETITLSRGAALGVACDDVGSPCSEMNVEVADPSIADARLSYAADFANEFRARPATEFVIFGKRAGETTVTVRSSGGDVTYDVVVEAR